MILALLLSLLAEAADVAALAWEESRWRTDAVSSRGCCGLMQVSPSALGTWLGRRWTCSQLQHPIVGLAAGVEMRRRWKERAEKAGKPGCYMAGYTSGNRGFKNCLDGKANQGYPSR